MDGVFYAYHGGMIFMGGFTKDEHSDNITTIDMKHTWSRALRHRRNESMKFDTLDMQVSFGSGRRPRTTVVKLLATHTVPLETIYVAMPKPICTHSSIARDSPNNAP